jgi:hypothetical protein
VNRFVNIEVCWPPPRKASDRNRSTSSGVGAFGSPHWTRDGGNGGGKCGIRVLTVGHACALSWSWRSRSTGSATAWTVPSPAYRRVERPRYGFYLDHVLDIVGITILLGGLAASTVMSPVIALSLVVA